MSGHVTYACNCLNIRIHLANKYYLEGHEKYRRNKFVRLEEPPISGWQFELSMTGVVVAYSSLIRIRRIMDNPSGWITISCHNCTSGDVYSVKRPNAKTTYPIDTSIMSQFGDQVIIHKGTIFGQDIDRLQKKVTYSNAFHIVLNPDLPVNHVSLEKDEDDSFGSELLSQKKHVQQLLKQSLIDLEEITEKRIQVYQQEQEILLIREKEKAMYDGAILWQTMKEISKTIHEEEQRVRRLSLYKTNDGVTDQILFNRIMQYEQYANVIRDSPQDPVEEEILKHESHVHFSHANDTILGGEHHQQRTRSSAFKRDLFGGFAPASYNRRSSYVLDESAIANSFKKEHNHHHQSLAPVNELPPFRRRSSLVPPNQHHLHPLAAASAHNPETNIALPVTTSSNTSSSWEDEDDDEGANKLGNGNQDDDNEDMFALDEDIEESNHDIHVSEEIKLSGRRPSSKYIEMFDEVDEDDIDEKPAPASKKDASYFATSVPIAISHPPAFMSVQNEITMQSSVHPKHPSSSFIEPTYLNKAEEIRRTRQPSFVGFDYAEADREASSQFPPLDIVTRRKSGIPAVTLNHAPSSVNNGNNNNTNNNTRYHLSSNKNKIQLENSVLRSFNEDGEEEEEKYNGPMIPPHILAANIVTDEAEAIFGSIPRNSIRNRPIE